MRRVAMVLATVGLIAATAAPNVAYAKHGHGGEIALGIIGGLLVGNSIASLQPSYVAPQPYYPPQYYDPPAAYYGPPAVFDAPPPAYYQAVPYGYASDDD